MKKEKKTDKPLDDKKIDKYLEKISSHLKLSRNFNMKDIASILLEKDREYKFTCLSPAVINLIIINNLLINYLRELSLTFNLTFLSFQNFQKNQENKKLLLNFKERPKSIFINFLKII